MRSSGNRTDKKKLSWIYRKKIKSQKSKNVVENTDDNIEDKTPRIVRNVPFKVGRIISSSWAISKSEYCEKMINRSIVNLNRDTNNTNADEALKKDGDKQDKDSDEKKKLAETKKQRRKMLKAKNRKKRARIIVRNLSFQVTKESLRDHFSQYGKVEEINILTRSDGKNVGCAFLQFDHVQSAAKAIRYANFQPLLHRPIVVDWAVPKNKFNNSFKNEAVNEVKVKIEEESDTENVDLSTNINESKPNIDEGSVSEAEIDIVTDVEESDSVDSTEVKVKSKHENEVSNGQLSIDYEESILNEKEEKEKRPRYESHDVAEGKTIFLKNVPFSVKNEELKKYIEQFGPVYYALICMDPLTEYSKGTAFVKFKKVEDAEKCLSAGNELQMDDQILEAKRALDKSEIGNVGSSKYYRQKDSRNLYLVKEGVVLAGSQAAVGVSAADMAKRLQIEQWKSQILRNLHMFVSRTRLVIHNLPPTLNDVKLRKIVERYSSSNAIIKEVRIMRDLKNVDMKGIGKSKEYGFVSFTRHEDALEALRNINNNPNIFTPKRRPIVSFSIENRVLVNAKLKRLQKSRENNPLWSENKRKGENMNNEVERKKLKYVDENESSSKSYAGMIGKPGVNKISSKFNVKTQAILHNQTVKREKKMKKSSKKLEIKKRAKIANKNEIKPKQKTKIHADDMNLDKLVNKYKNTLKSVQLKKSKWYES